MRMLKREPVVHLHRERSVPHAENGAPVVELVVDDEEVRSGPEYPVEPDVRRKPPGVRVVLLNSRLRPGRMFLKPRSAPSSAGRYQEESFDTKGQIISSFFRGTFRFKPMPKMASSPDSGGSKRNDLKGNATSTS